MFERHLKLFNLKCTLLEFKRLFSGFESNHQILTEYFGLSNIKANHYIEREKLTRLEPETFVKIVTYCKEKGFENHDILKNPILLRTCPTTLDQYYTVMTEGGFKNISARTLAKFRTINRRTIRDLKFNHMIDPKTDVVSSFTNYLNPCPNNFHVTTRGDSDSWGDVHLQVLSQYLKWRLNVTDDDVARLVKVHRGLNRKSFKYLCENIKIAEELGFTPDKMIKYGYILHAYPKNTKEILEKHPEIAGTCTRKAMRMYPKLITVPLSNIEKIHNILKSHNIPDHAIAKRMNVFHLSPETVELRLSELERIDDFKVLLNNPNILKLVVHHNRAKSRLSFLKNLQLRCAGVSVLGNDDSRFDIHVREGRDANTSGDMHSFLKGIFKKDFDRYEKLKKHPYHLQVSLVSMGETFNYLKSEKFSSAAIYNVICVLLYPVEKVKKSFQQVKLFERESGKALTQVNKLNLVLYFIEKEHHFSGDGVWNKNEVIEDSSL